MKRAAKATAIPTASSFEADGLLRGRGSDATTSHGHSGGVASAAAGACAGRGGVAAGGDLALVIAHPDDESMFFVPTLRSILASPRCRVHVLCLSTGNADGLGRIRTTELLAACQTLGVPSDCVELVDHPQLQDGFDQRWPSDVVASLVGEFVSRHRIQTLLTFDSFGVSGHPNHTAVHRAIRLMLDHGSLEIPAWQLDSASLPIKFLGPIGALFLWMHVEIWRGFFGRAAKREIFFCPSMLLSFRAMRCHKSQWIWFRWLFVLFSVYTFANTLTHMGLSEGGHSRGGVQESLPNEHLEESSLEEPQQSKQTCGADIARAAYKSD